MNKEEHEALWRERLKAQRESGLSVPAWCNREGICESHMYRWRRPLRERGEWAPALIAVPMLKVEVAVVPLESKRLAPAVIDGD